MRKKENGNTKELFRFYAISSLYHISDLPDVNYKEKIVIWNIETGPHKADIPNPENASIDVPTSVPHYGVFAGLFHLWKNETSEYIGFSLGIELPVLDKEIFQKMEHGNLQICAIKPHEINCSLRENYRTMYYGYDFRVMMDILRLTQKTYYEYANSFFDGREFLRPCAIMRKDVFRKFCVWLFPILKQCEQYIADKKSKMQDESLQFIGYYLLMLYISYNEQKGNIKINYVLENKGLVFEKENIDLNEIEASAEMVEMLLGRGEVEKAIGLVKSNPQNTSLEKYQRIFETYLREKRYYKTTIVDKDFSADQFDDDNDVNTKNCIATNNKKVLVFKWNSISHKESVRALETLGFECTEIEIGEISVARSESVLGSINHYFDSHSFAFAFSINYINSLAEACYVHNIPYIAWAYDSPANFGDRRYLHYDTNHIFLFDSEEAKKEQKENKNFHYMPLAVNVDHYDEMLKNTSFFKKYESQISFVGRLYDNDFATMMSHLDDYKKGYLNGLIENSLSTWDFDFFEEIVTPQFYEWVVNRKVDEIIIKQNDWPNPSVPQKASALRLMLKKSVTNRERILLIGLLSKFWQFKLYSDSSHEIFKDTIECGVVNYYSEMPHVFRNSKINLNITFRSIKTGIPLRCLDIMGCRGLLLTNHQKDFDEHFQDGKNLLFYHSLDEAYDKCKFYLEHETQREKIEIAGYETVKKYYNYPDLMRKVIQESDLGYLL